MIGDPTGALTRYFHVMTESAGTAQRGTFIIDPQGVIQALEIHADGIGRNAEELVRKLEAAQFVAEHGDQVCPPAGNAATRHSNRASTSSVISDRSSPEATVSIRWLLIVLSVKLAVY